MKYTMIVSALGLLAACGGGGGGGGGGGTTSSEIDNISGKTLNPAQAIQDVYQMVGSKTIGSDKYQYTQGPLETIDGQQFNVQNILILNAAGNTQNLKRYYKLNPFSIYSPPKFYVTDAALNQIPINDPNYYYKVSMDITSALSLGVLPTSAKVGDFGVYENSPSYVACTIKINAGSCYTTSSLVNSSWTLEKFDANTALLCFGATNNPRLTNKTCYKINSISQVVGD
jgi:hypothetical protein